MKDQKRIPKLKSESGGEYGVIQGRYEMSMHSKKLKKSKNSILSSKDASPKKKLSSQQKKNRLNDLLQRKGSIYQGKFAEYAFKPKIPSKSPNRKIKPATFSFTNSIKKNKNLQKKFTFNFSNSNLVNISNRSLQKSKNFQMSGNKKFNQNYYKDSSSKKHKMSNKLFFLKKNHNTMSKEKSFHKKNQFNLNQLIYKQSNNQNENKSRMGNLQDQLTNRNVKKKPISISNLAAYYETGKQRNKLLRRTSEVQYLMTEKNSMISKKSNRSLQLFNSKDKIRSRKKESFQKFHNIQKFPIEFIPKKIYESAISIERRDMNNFSQTREMDRPKHIGLQNHLIKPALNHKRYLSNNLEDLRPLKRPMSLSQVKKSLISKNKKKNLNFSIQFNQNISQPSFIIGGSNDHLESFSNQRESLSKKKVKKLSILEGSPKKNKFSKRSRIFSNKNLCSNDKKQTNSLRNLLMKKRLKKGFSIGNSMNNSYKMGKDHKQGRVELTFQKSKKYFTNLRIDKLNTSNSKIFRENPYNSYYQRE